jgi:hypothetical protein
MQSPTFSGVLRSSSFKHVPKVSHIAKTHQLLSLTAAMVATDSNFLVLCPQLYGFENITNRAMET